MKLNKFAPKKNVAQAMVEFAIVLPILLLLLYGLLEAGRLLFMYSTIVTASRQAVRYGTATGLGIGTTTVERYRDCVGIRDAAQKANYLKAFNHENNDIQIFYDQGTADTADDTPICPPGAPSASDWDPTNESRLIVVVTGHFHPIVPLIVPFGERDITAQSARSILVSVPIVVATGAPTADTTEVQIQTIPNPSLLGGDVALGVIVTNTSGTAVPIGDVTLTFEDGTSLPGTCASIPLDTAGLGGCTLSFNTMGDIIIHATFEPTDPAVFATSSIIYTHHVDKASTSITINDPFDPSQSGVEVPFAFNVNTTFGTPTGTVEITASSGTGSCLGTHTLSGGPINCTLTFNSVSTVTINAHYSGDAQHEPSDGVETHVVTLEPPPTHTFTPIPSPTFTPVPATPTFTPTPAATPVLGCDNIKNQYVGIARPIQVSNKTMYLEITNPNAYSVSINHILAHWNYLAGRAGGDGKLYLQDVTFNGQTPPVWTGNLNAYSLDLTLPTPLILPGNGAKSTLVFTFQTTYKYPAGEEIIIDFSTPGCEMSSIHLNNP